MLVERFVLDFAKRIPPSSHVAVFYNNPYDKWSILSSFVKANLEKKQSIICFSDGTYQSISSGLYEAGIDLTKMSRSGGLTISNGERWYLGEVSLKERRIFDTWIDAVQNALSRGFEGLCVICEPADLFGPDLPGVLSYEKSLPKRFSSPLSVVCQYSVEDLLSFEDGTLLLKLADVHSHIITPAFVGAISFSDFFDQSLRWSLDSILGKTISSVFFSFVKAKRRRYKGNRSARAEGLDRYLNEFFGDNASRFIKRHILKEQYERIGLKFTSLV